jgi:hypothetical protein
MVSIHNAVIALGLVVAGNAFAASPDHADNFALLDQNGRHHELYYLSDMKAVVLMAHENDCDAVDESVPTLEAAKAGYASKGVEFLMLNAADTRETIAAHSKASIPVLVDDRRLVSESLQMKRASEVIVLDPRGWKIVYRGPVASRKDPLLTAALDSVLAGQPVKKAHVSARGCSVKLAKANVGKRVSYTDEIAPMLINNCVTCHRTGGIAPFAMTDYNVVKGFAPMIREVVRTKRMPPWHADPHVGNWQATRGLATEDAEKLVHWIEAGAPRGKGGDPLADYKKQWAEWEFGKPDVVVQVPAFDVPATGIIDYQYYVVPNPTGRDVWVRASDVIPGDRSVVHHVIVGIYDPTLPEQQRRIRQTSPELGAYVPGNGPTPYPEDTGVFLKKDQSIGFQVHYTSSGKVAHDVTRFGMYFRDTAPKYVFKTAVLANPRIRIPANTKAHTESVAQQFPRDILVYRLTPHAHFRGSATGFVAKYPDGHDETLLAVPKYDFNWQTTYTFVTPKLIPAGTKIVHSTTYDNSTQNPANPDHNRVVPWGEQSFDEMLYGVVQYRELTPDAEQLSQATAKATN